MEQVTYSNYAATVPVPQEASFRRTAPPATKEEPYLVARAKRGCSTSFGELYERHRPRIHRVALRILRNEQDSEDAVQRAFQRAYMNLSKFREDSTFLTWLTRIAMNEALMMLRSRRRVSVMQESSAKDETKSKILDVADSRPTPEQVFAQRELRIAMLRSISTLRPSLRSVVLLSELKGCSNAETARQLGLSVSAVKARLFHARRNLRRHFKRNYGTRKRLYVTGSQNASN
jgi:RNA polymerase sigma-70 factor, ECF subfamily